MQFQNVSSFEVRHFSEINLVLSQLCKKHKNKIGFIVNNQLLALSIYFLEIFDLDDNLQILKETLSNSWGANSVCWETGVGWVEKAYSSEEQSDFRFRLIPDDVTPAIILEQLNLAQAQSRKHTITVLTIVE